MAIFYTNEFYCRCNGTRLLLLGLLEAVPPRDISAQTVADKSNLCDSNLCPDVIKINKYKAKIRLQTLFGSSVLTNRY